VTAKNDVKATWYSRSFPEWYNSTATGGGVADDEMSRAGSSLPTAFRLLLAGTVLDPIRERAVLRALRGGFRRGRLVLATGER
jgi:hypothetical protein